MRLRDHGTGDAGGTPTPDAGGGARDAGPTPTDGGGRTFDAGVDAGPTERELPPACDAPLLDLGATPIAEAAPLACLE